MKKRQRFCRFLLFGLISVAGALVAEVVAWGKNVNASCGAGAIVVVTAIKFSAGDGDIVVFVVAVKGHILAHFH